MALTKLKSRKRRSSNVNKGMIKKTKNLGKKRRREGDDDKSVILAKSERREAKAEANRAAAKKKFAAADAAAGSAACDPLVTASIATGLGSYLDLTKTKQSCGFGAPYEKRIVAAELDARPRPDGRPWYTKSMTGMESRSNQWPSWFNYSKRPTEGAAECRGRAARRTTRGVQNGKKMWSRVRRQSSPPWHCMAVRLHRCVRWEYYNSQRRIR